MEQMYISQWLARWRLLDEPSRVILPTIAACLMLIASFLPWFKDPLDGAYNAWRIPVNFGWPVHLGALNYGSLCLCSALYALLVAWANVCPFNRSYVFEDGYVLAGFLCVLPVLLFLLQYLCLDIVGINTLAHHEVQWLLVRRHFGYPVTPQRIKLQPFDVDISTLQGRFSLLIEQASYGPVLVCLMALVLLDSRRYLAKRSMASAFQARQRRLLVLGVSLAFLILLGPGLLAVVCDYQAKDDLAAGDYTTASSWLNAAAFFNPALNNAAFYHRERGEIAYFLHNDLESVDSRLYLASVYRGIGDNLGAYQELLAAWKSHQDDPWVGDDVSLTLESLSEYIQPKNGSAVIRPVNAISALPWLALLLQVDPTNVYGQYAMGRIQYELHNFALCDASMLIVLRLSVSTDLQSSAYTYLALSEAGRGNYAQERILLLKAMELDPNYHNNTAREEISGLR